METKVLLAIFLQVVLVQCTSSQCIGKMMTEPIGATGMNVFSSQLTMQNIPLPPPSFSVFSDGLVVEGIVGVTGTLPFLGTVGMEGIVPAAGQGTVMYNTGDGTVGIISEMPVNGIISEMPVNGIISEMPVNAIANMYSVRY